MEYVDINENIERVYSVYYDKEKLRKLLDDIIRNASYKISGTFEAPSNATYEGNVFTSGATLINGDPKFEDIKRIYMDTSDGVYSYHNDTIRVEGTQIITPKLASIIDGILSEESNCILFLLDYKNDPELDSIDYRIELAEETVNNIDNYDYDKKIDALNHLKYLCEKKEKKDYCNAELLNEYYSQALSLIEVELVSEKKLIQSEKLLLKDCKLEVRSKVIK